MRPRPDAAENSGSLIRTAQVERSFNEAAARCRGKHWRSARRGGSVCHASMRPRPDAAENVEPRGLAVPVVRASMRPRPDAAENLRYAAEHRSTIEASMRPRPDAAENARTMRGSSMPPPRFNEAAARCRGKQRRRPHRGGRREASMRPRPDAAENGSTKPRRPARRAGFNEAAARCRGKLIGLNLTSWGSGIASMRPRPDAAENTIYRATAELIAALQ